MNGSVTPVSGRTLRLPAAMMNASMPMTSARPKAAPEQAAAREGVERLDDLVARPQGIGERVQPDVDPGPKVVEQRGHQGASEQEQDEADDDQADPARRAL